jgi:hypothetical protein
MSKKNPIAALAALQQMAEHPVSAEKKEKSRPKPVIAGQEAASHAKKVASTKKNKLVAVRLSDSDLAITSKLALQLRKHGLQYSEANAVRLSLRLFNGSAEQIAEIAEEIKAEDGRKIRGKA